MLVSHLLIKPDEGSEIYTLSQYWGYVRVCPPSLSGKVTPTKLNRRLYLYLEHNLHFYLVPACFILTSNITKNLQIKSVFIFRLSFQKRKSKKFSDKIALYHAQLISQAVTELSFYLYKNIGQSPIN